MTTGKNLMKQFHELAPGTPEKNEEFLIELIDKTLMHAKKQQRHACAEAVVVAASYGDGDVDDMVSVNEAQNACMNASV